MTKLSDTREQLAAELSVIGRRAEDTSPKPTVNSPRVIAVVVLINVVSLIVSFSVANHHIEDIWLGVALLSTLAALAGAGPVRIPSFKTSISTTDAFVFAALGGYGALPAVLVSGAGVLGSIFSRQPERRALRMAFNVGNMTLSAGAAAAVYLFAGGVPGAPSGSQVAPLFVAVIVYVGLNTGLVALVVVVDTDRQFLSTWVEAVRWAAVSASLGGALAVGLLWAIDVVGTSGLALGIPPCWVLASFYRTHKERQEFQQERIQRVEGINEILEDRVTERTVELQRALSHIENANERLTQTNERLTQANRAKSEFLANVSHELRTPLNAIIGFSELLAEPKPGGLGPRQIEYVQDIHESGDHLLSLINNILDVSKIEAGKMDCRPVCFALPKAISESVAMLRPQAANREVDLGTECADDAPFVELDPGLFRQLLVNLLSNAVKFTDGGGKVTVHSRREGDVLLVEVRDTGIGIPAEQLGQIFDEFYQVDGSYARNYEGTGLGLTLVQRMVAIQGGTIGVESTEGEGSTFTCRFPGVIRDSAPEEAHAEPLIEHTPIPRDRRAAAAPTAEPDPIQSDENSILVVDANPMNRKLARNALRSQGYTVLEATTAEEAIELLHGTAPALVLMDLELPGVSGLEAMRLIKSDPRMAGCPIVALTPPPGKSDDAGILDEGFAGSIAKPIRLAKFPKQVAEFMAGETVTA